VELSSRGGGAQLEELELSSRGVELSSGGVELSSEGSVAIS